MQSDDALIEAGRKLCTGACAFVTGAASLAGLPDGALPEVAFAGRSNVGKSSLLNALTGRRALARTSQTPGRTRQLNFFDLAGRLMLVDMPGYGYAKAPKTEIAAWHRLIETYLMGRPGLRRLFLLVDARHGLKPSDRELMEMLDQSAVSYQVVLTKADKSKRAALEHVVAETAEAIAKQPAALPEILITSAREGTGIDQLRAALAGIAETE
ncbi:MAG: ribosome biogenesis GTP-binding protein YihA/YsxC [Alphaproteobacteria bacterium]|nr:ribosome biogenesis GTP-binding protein YihA/YsxC [Alphaproteobacteria bacterium]